MKKLIYMAGLLAITSCTYDSMRLQQPEELGTEKDSYIIEAEGGCAEVKVYANMEGNAFLEEGTSWAEVTDGYFTSDQTIIVTAGQNTGRARMAELILMTAARKDTVLIKQRGVKEEYLSIPTTAVVIKDTEDKVNVPVNTNADPEFITFKVDYTSADGEWIEDVTMSGQTIVISCSKNASDATRDAVITVMHDNGWGEVSKLSLRATQAGSGNILGTHVSFAELKATAGEFPAEITRPYIIEGHIISDIESGNVGENIQTTSTTINYTVCRRTAYIQAKDGGSGFLLEFETEEDNIVKFNSLVSLRVEKATLSRFSNPERYSITGLKASSVLSCTETDPAMIKTKTCRMSQLQDSDIYTRVTVSDCEFPIRKGSLTPLHEGYTSVTNRHRVTKFPTLIRDIEGNSMYLFTNTTCTHRREGQQIGYGKGSATGVLVHEKYRRFIDGESADEDECGNIGKYQIRHMAFNDIAFEADMQEGFSGIICEWRYIDAINPDGSWNATLGEGKMTHTLAPDSRFMSSGMTGSANDYSYLGPVFSTETHANTNGFGIDDIDGNSSIKKQDITKGSFSAAAAEKSKVALAWRNNKWYGGNQYQSWIVSFSTKNISTDVLSMQLSVLNTSGGSCPNEWKAEWAESPTATEWNLIANYNVPDIVRDAITEAWQSPGYKPIDIKLPAAMLGKQTVYVRLTPRSRKGSTVLYLDGNFSNGSYSAMNYFAIRYNK